MSVLIRGMEKMPTSCYDCPVECEMDLCGITQGGCTWDVRPPHCPLIEIQPHGRLIDADALIMDKGIDTYNAVFAVANAPTIIEGDET